MTIVTLCKICRDETWAVDVQLLQACLEFQYSFIVFCNIILCCWLRDVYGNAIKNSILQLFMDTIKCYPRCCNSTFPVIVIAIRWPTFLYNVLNFLLLFLMNYLLECKIHAFQGAVPWLTSSIISCNIICTCISPWF